MNYTLIVTCIYLGLRFLHDSMRPLTGLTESQLIPFSMAAADPAEPFSAGETAIRQKGDGTKTGEQWDRSAMADHG